MRAMLFGTAALMVSVSLAQAGDVMANCYGNTIVAKTPGSEFHVYYRADHTFDGVGHGPNGTLTLHGKWFLDDKGQLCRNYDALLPGMTNPVCTSWSSHNVGDTWTLGSNVTLTLVAGIQ